MAATPSSSLLSDPATIAANRVGQLTPWQRQHLRPPSLVGSQIALVFSWAALAIGVYFFLILPFWGLLRSNPDIASLFNLSSGELIFVVLFLGIFSFFTLLVSGGLLIPNTRRLLVKLRLRRDLAEGYITQEDGQVTFVRKLGYEARGVGGRLYNLDGGATVELPPGEYHFFLLPRSRRVLSAEVQMSFSQGSQQLSLLAALARAHGFSLDELNANRQGWLSTRQRLAVIRSMLYFPMIVAVLVALIVLAAIEQWRVSPWIIVLIAAGLAPLVFPYRTMRDLREGRVVMLEGVVDKKEEADESVSYYYSLGTLDFPVSADAYRALIPGKSYRMYCLPHSKSILTIEPLP
jgi:hypothetical protein